MVNGLNFSGEFEHDEKIKVGTYYFVNGEKFHEPFIII